MAELHFLVGVSGVGKSYYAEKISKKIDAKIISSDAVRAELWNDENDQQNPAVVFDIVNARVKEALWFGFNVVYDATNLSMKRRRAFVESLLKISCKKVCHIVVAPYEDCVARQDLRERKVSEEVIKKQIKQFQCPWYYEGWDEIVVHRNGFNNLPDMLNEATRISHDNPHHSLSIGGHMNRCYAHYMIDYEGDDDERLSKCSAFLYHDIGKPFCKEFKDSKGNISEVAHYYGHQNASAWIYLCGRPESNAELYNAVLINWHMEPFLRPKASLEKFYELIGNELTNDIKLLHHYDVLAH